MVVNTEIGRNRITSVSAVRSRGAFCLNLPIQGLGYPSWRDRSDPAAHAKHYATLLYIVEENKGRQRLSQN